MKPQNILLLILTTTLINSQLLANTEPLNIGNEVNELMEESMSMEINGAVQLYSVLKEEIELINTETIQNVNNEATNNSKLAYNRDYFIGYGDNQVEAITPSNFKRIAKKYFTNVPALAANIGKRGFRYKNLPTIILFYNKQITEGKTLTKEDKLVVKQIQG